MRIFVEGNFFYIKYIAKLQFGNLIEIALKERTKYGVFLTPAVVIDGEVKSTGKIPTTEEIKAWIRK